MTPNAKHVAIFIAAVVLANAITILVTAWLFRTAPGLREHHPGF